MVLRFTIRQMVSIFICQFYIFTFFLYMQQNMNVIRHNHIIRHRPRESVWVIS